MYLMIRQKQQNSRYWAWGFSRHIRQQSQKNQLHRQKPIFRQQVLEPVLQLAAVQAAVPEAAVVQAVAVAAAVVGQADLNQF
jgi:hypothetical protein